MNLVRKSLSLVAMKAKMRDWQTIVNICGGILIQSKCFIFDPLDKREFFL